MNYALGSGGFKLGERVEILTTKQRGILISEVIHISGCNTYQVLLPKVIKDGRMRITHRDHLVLRKLDSCESIFDNTKTLTDDNSFSPKGIDVNAEWILAAVSEDKEYITEVDDAVGVEEIAIYPGMEVWNKVYGKTMLITYICRDIYSKELEYGAVYMVDDKEELVTSRAYALIPIESKLQIHSESKTGPIFEDGRNFVINESRFIIEELGRLHRGVSDGYYDPSI